MKYIKKYESFKNEVSEPVNEEFLGKLLGGIKNLFKKGQERLNKTKGGKEIEVIYQKYLKLIHDQLSKTAQVDLNLAAASKGEEATPAAKPGAITPAGAPAGATASAPAAPGAPGAAKESATYNGYGKVFEADANAQNAKLAVDTLKKKKTIMDQIVAKLKEQAAKEMDAVLAKFGGASGNPQLNILLQTKKDEFDMAYLNAQIAYLDAAGDKTMIGEITKKRDIVMKKIEAEMKGFDAAKVIEYEVGDEVIYLLKGKKPEEYDAKKKPEDQKAIVGVHKIAEIDGDNFTLEDEKGEPTIKKIGKEIMGKVAGDPADEFKVGDFVIHLKEGKKKEEWDALKDDEKKDPSGEKAKEIVGVHKIEKIDGDKYTFKDSKGVDFTKTKDQILGKSEAAPKVEGQEDLVKKLGDMKTKKPDDLKKVSSYVDFINDEKNAAKVAEIEKIIGEGGAQAQK